MQGEKMYRKGIRIAIILIMVLLTVNGVGCGSNVNDLKVENVSRFIKNSTETSIKQEDFFFELLNYHEQSLYLENGYSLTKWMFVDGEFICKKSLAVIDLFPQEYEDINHTIEYIKNDEMNMVSDDGRFIYIFNARDPIAFYIWDIEDDVLNKICMPSLIRKMQWADDESLLYLLTKDNRLYSFDPVEEHSDVITICADISDIDDQQIRLTKDGVIYLDGINVRIAKGDSEAKIIVSNVSEFFGVYQNSIVVRRMNGMIEAGHIDEEWRTFYSDKMNVCYPVNGRYLCFYKTSNHSDVGLMDLVTGNLTSYSTFGHGYEVFPKTDVLLSFDNNGTPYIQRPNESAKPLQLGRAEAHENKTAMIAKLTHEGNGIVGLMLFSLEDQQWLKYKITF